MGSGSGPRSARAVRTRFVAAIAAALVAASAAPAHAGSAWSVVPSATVAKSGQSYLDGVSCAPTGGVCFAVGSVVTVAGTTRPLVEQWNGRRWTAMSTPKERGIASALVAVSCPTAKSCVAVGNSRATEKSPSIPLVARWSGGRWSFANAPRPSGATGTYLKGVSCASATNCIAVGNYTSGFTSGTPVALRSKGKSWSLMKLPAPGKAAATSLDGVSCTGAGASAVCWAVGSYVVALEGIPFYTVTERLAHGKWTLVPSANYHRNHSSALTAVSCASPKSCLAVGNWSHASGATFGERWNGSRWTEVRTRNPRGFTFSSLAGVSCTSASRCIATGTYSMGAPKSLTLVEQWNGNSWQIQPSPQPRKSSGSALMGVSCVSGTRCVAVGTYLTNKFGNPAAGFSQRRS
jgi:hypothetical protein